MTSEVAHPLLRKVDDVIANHPDRIAIIDKDGVEYSYATLSKKILQASPKGKRCSFGY